MNFLEHISIDLNHIELIYSLLICHKPINCLELGIGSGSVTTKIIEAFLYNDIAPDIDCVDNFIDWHGKCPDHIYKLQNINIIVSNEYDFLVSCNKTYDFIISDADHNNTDQWVDQTLKLVNQNGILIYHDINNKDFPNLKKIITQIKNLKLNHMLFTKNSKPQERCDRGLLIIQNRNNT